MYIVDFTKPIHIHFIGIGGISMSGLAEILLKEGFRISGSDAKESSLTDHLTQLGADIRYGQRSSNIQMTLIWSFTLPLSTRITRNTRKPSPGRFPC